MVAIKGQNYQDLCIAALGTMEYLFELAQANDVSITEDAVPGQEIKLPIGLQVHTTVLRIYASKGVKPATNSNIVIAPSDGIGYMAINDTFIIM